MAQGRKTGGRQAGTPNKITTVFKDAVRIVYDEIGGHSAFAEWAKDNPGDFYKIASKLIPAEQIRPAHDNHISITISGIGESNGDLIEHQDDVKLIGQG